MNRYKKALIEQSAKEVLFLIFDIAAPFFYADRMYRKSVINYQKWREKDRVIARRRIQYLKSQGIIEAFTKNKKQYFELTDKGLQYLINTTLKQISIKNSVKWDGKWRMVIFDIPEKYHSERNIFRFKLLNLGFQKIQRSVYVYPYECTNEINFISQRLNIDQFVLITISELIQNEEVLISNFITNKIIPLSDIKK